MFSSKFSLGFAICALVFSCAAVARPSRSELAKAAEAEALGAEMYGYDQAAWHSTDQLQADIGREGEGFEALHKLGVTGYIVEPSANGALVTTFFGMENDRKIAVARYLYSGSATVTGGLLRPEENKELSVLALRMIDARDAALDRMVSSKYGLCSESPYNSLVLPPRQNGRIISYVLTSTTVTGVFPAGGHYRFDFDGKGKLVDQRSFMNSCFPIDSRSESGTKPVATVLTHLLDPQPTEIHAFVSRNIPIELYITTVSNKYTWSVNQGRIKFVKDLPKSMRNAKPLQF